VHFLSPLKIESLDRSGKVVVSIEEFLSIGCRALFSKFQFHEFLFYFILFEGEQNVLFLIKSKRNDVGFQLIIPNNQTT